MKVIIDIRHLSRPPYTGVAESTILLIEGLAVFSSDIRQVLFYSGSKPPPSFVSLWPKRFSNVELVIKRIPNRFFDLSAKFFSFPKIDKTIKGADVFLSPNALLAPLAGLPRVLVIHDLSFAKYPEFFSFKSKAWHYFMNIRKQASGASHIIVPSKSTRNDLVDFWNISENKISVVPWGLPDQGLSDKFKTKFFPLSQKTGPVVFLGTIEPRKNVLGIIKAFEFLKKDGSFPDLKLVLAGAFAFKSDSVLAYARNSFARNAISFLGYINDDQKYKLLSSASLLVYPSFYEGFGLPVLEAMSFGLPVITSRFSSLPEVGGDAVVLVDPHNFREIAYAMRSVLSDPKLKQELVGRSIKRAERFSQKETVGQIASILKKKFYAR